LDNAATTQKPQAVLDAIVEYYRTTNANVHRGAYDLAIRATEAYEAARAKLAEFVNAWAPEGVVFTRGTTSDQPGGGLVWPCQREGWRQRGGHRDGPPLESDAVANLVSGAGCHAPHGRDHRGRADRSRRFRPGARAAAQDRRVSVRVQRARHRESGGAARQARARRRRGRRGGRGPVDAAPESRPPGARLRLLRPVGSQDARADGLGGAGGQARAARGHAALPRRGRDDLARVGRSCHLQQE